MTLWKEPGSWVERFESTLTAATNAARRLYANPPPPDAGPNWLPDADGPGAECRRASLDVHSASVTVTMRDPRPSVTDLLFWLYDISAMALRGWASIPYNPLSCRKVRENAPGDEWLVQWDALHVMAGREMNARSYAASDAQRD